MEPVPSQRVSSSSRLVWHALRYGKTVCSTLSALSDFNTPPAYSPLFDLVSSLCWVLTRRHSVLGVCPWHISCRIHLVRLQSTSLACTSLYGLISSLCWALPRRHSGTGCVSPAYPAYFLQHSSCTFSYGNTACICTWCQYNYHQNTSVCSIFLPVCFFF